MSATRWASISIAGLCVGFFAGYRTTLGGAPNKAERHTPSFEPNKREPSAKVSARSIVSNEMSTLIPYATARLMRVNGHYVLDSETFERKEALEERAYRTGDATMEKRAAGYKALFTALHLDSGSQSELLDRLRKIYEAKARVANSMSVLQKARESYDERVEKVLADHYQQYLDYEAAYLPSIEVGEIANLANASNVSLSESEKAILHSLIQEYNALTIRSLEDLGGPYGDVRPLTSGREFNIAMNAESARLRSAYERLLTNASQKGMSEVTLRVTREYYQNESAKYAQLKAPTAPVP